MAEKSMIGRVMGARHDGTTPITEPPPVKLRASVLMGRLPDAQAPGAAVSLGLGWGLALWIE